MLGKVLILSASAGAGHLRAADALEKAVHRMNAAKEVRHIDTLDYTNKAFRGLYQKAYIEMVNKMPEALGWLYDYFDKPWQKERRRLALDKLNSHRFVKMLKEESPDVVICTHFLPAEIISWLKAKQQLSCRQAIVVTDFDVHAMWLCHHYEQYFVPIDESRVHLEKLGIPADKITVSGIPIDPVFAIPKDRRDMRLKHGLDPDRTTILVSAGGWGVGPIEHLIEVLAQLQHRVQIITICGRNETLRNKLAESAMKLNNHVAIKPIGYTTEMDEYMAASDLLVGKPGGLTTSEALARGLIMVIVNPIRGQEERNSDHLLEEGVAIRCNNLPTLAYKIDRLLDQPRQLAAMRESAIRMGRPNAAKTVIEAILRRRPVEA
jgi:processive 1,2-diacylglycerol beta-glucosyltransferase